MMRMKLAAIMRRYPNLTAWGFLNSDDDCFESGRERLAESAALFASCIGWLSANRPMLAGRSAYCIKHYVERAHSPAYVPQGCVIAAALHLGIPYTLEQGGCRF